MLGFGPTAAKPSLILQHAPCLVQFESSFLGSEWSFHPVPLETKLFKRSTKKNPLEGLYFALSMVKVLLSKPFPSVLLQTLWEMEEEAP